MKKIFTPPLKKFKSSLILACTLLLLLQSCKKELLISSGEKIDPTLAKQNQAYHNNKKIKTINFNSFKDKVNLNALGTLKSSFINPKGINNKSISISTEETYLGFALHTDSIKVISDNGHVRYVFAVKSPYPRAVTFQNLTIDESETGTIAFVTTYTPTRKWINDQKKGLLGKFDGEVTVDFLNLTNANPLPTPAKTITSGKTNSSVTQGPPTTANMVLECTMVDFYYYEPFLCAGGNHGPEDAGCPYEGYLRAGYTAHISTQEVCSWVQSNPPLGGGGTTTNPPPGYDPCDETPPPSGGISNKKKTGNQIMVIPPNLCDSIEVPSEIINNLTDLCLKSTYNAITNTGNINNKINTLIQGVFNVNDKVNLIYNQSTSLPSTQLGSTDAEYKFTEGNGSKRFDVTVSLNANVLPGYSQELTAVTMLHEALHGYFEYTGVFKADATAQHLLMAAKYVDLLRTSVQSVYPNLANLDANILILSEMADIYTQYPQTYANLLAQYNITASQYNNIIPTYKSGSAGTRCGNQ